MYWLNTHKQEPFYELVELMVKSTFRTASRVVLRIKFDIEMIRSLSRRKFRVYFFFMTIALTNKQ